ncbi:hypothetical protein [Paraburkholderia phenoliruptrix]|uniref:hypothetical protein n=1 Tax=Paraburkholderia phenoliruptrix TaxID=252970 RepID=UPI0034CD9484
MQSESHWFLKDLLTVFTLLGVFYSTQEGRDGNPTIRRAMSVVENRYTRLNTWMKEASEAQVVAWLWVVTRRILIGGIILMIVAAKAYPHPTHAYRTFAYVLFAFIFVFTICNKVLSGDRYLDWRPVKWGALAALFFLAASAFIQFSDTEAARAASTSLNQIPFTVRFGLESNYLPLTVGGISALMVAALGLIVAVGQALPFLVGRLVIGLTLRSMKGLATFIAWLDPQRTFAWFMFLACSVIQIISNHL